MRNCGRNFDYPHFDTENNITGLNVVVNCAPSDGYHSVALADAVWISKLGVPYDSGSLDSGKVSLLPLSLIPYLCMDGINEKGLVVSILAVDTKTGESVVSRNVKGKEKVNITKLLRILLDNCADVDEAIKKSQEYNMIDTLGGDYHLFVVDESGVSVVLEWRNNQLTVTHTDVVTNFYVNSDDAEDVYAVDGTLMDKFERPADVPVWIPRFRTIISKRCKTPCLSAWGFTSPFS